MSDYLNQFRDEIISTNLVPPSEIIGDGELHRFASNGKQYDDAGWYVLHLDGVVPCGVFGCWRNQIFAEWKADIGRTLTTQEKADFTALAARMKEQREQDKVARQIATARSAKTFWEDYEPAADTHPYLVAKGIKPHGCRESSGLLQIPIYDGDELVNVQRVLINNSKLFMRGGKVSGCYNLIGDATGAQVLCVAEGFATAASVHESTGYPTYAAFNAGNLSKVAQRIRNEHPSATVLICGDDDWKTEGNPGRTSAIAAADAVFGKWVLPVFGEGREDKQTDFNDLASAYGLGAVKDQIQHALDGGANSGSTQSDLVNPASESTQAVDESAEAQLDADALDGGNAEEVGGDDPGTSGALSHSFGADSLGSGDAKAPKAPIALPEPDKAEWDSPLAFVDVTAPMPYPVEALPPTVRDAVAEVAGFTQAPIALVAGCALAALSVSAQALANAERAEGLKGPINLSILTLAESGERKSTVDGHFTEAIKEFQNEERIRLAPEMEKYEANLAAWEAEAEGIKAAIKANSKGNKPVHDLQSRLQNLHSKKPIKPLNPRIILSDETPENLARSLQGEWPSAGILSSEGGVVVGGRGMNKESVMGYLGDLNVYWDGGSKEIGRITSGSITVEKVRLTVGLLMQPETLKAFMSGPGNLARGIGFFARCLIAAPESTRGTRLFKDPPKSYPAKNAFKDRLLALLRTPGAFNKVTGLNPRMMPLDEDAKAEWIKIHDQIENNILKGGEYCAIADVASKAADNVARLAALFELIESPTSVTISKSMVDRAGQIVRWHLNEALRFFGEIALPKEINDAIRLDSWLIRESVKEGTTAINKRVASQYCKIRGAGVFDAAVEVLVDLNRAREVVAGKKKFLHINPKHPDLRH